MGKGSSVMPLHHIAAIIQADIGLSADEINSEPDVDWMYAKVDPDELEVEFAYQRYIQTRRIKPRAANWKPSAASPLICVLRTDLGTYRIVDGLQRGTLMSLIRTATNSQKKIDIQYIECDNIEQEFNMFLTMNTERDKVEDADIHKIEVKLGMKSAVDLDNVVRAAGFYIARPGTASKNALTHYAHTKNCFKFYGKKLTTILRRTRMHYKHEKLDGAVIYALLILQEKLRSSGKYTKTLFDDILISTVQHFGTQTRLKRAASNTFLDENVTSKTGDDDVSMNAPVKIASTIISSYNRIKNTNLCTKLYNNLVIHLIDKNKFPHLHPTFDAATYGTRKIYEEVSVSGDLRLPWAYFTAKEHNSKHEDKINFRDLYEICPSHCGCRKPEHELDYRRGKNLIGVKGDHATPSLHHTTATSNGGANTIDNCRVICVRTNRFLSNATAEDKESLVWAADNAGKRRENAAKAVV